MVLNQKAGGLEGYILSLERPTKLWHIPDHDVATSPLIYQGNVYIIGGGDYGKTSGIRCADLLSGKVSWAQRVLPQGCSSPIAADGKIFGYVQFGKLLCMWKADPDQYTPLATAPVKADGYSSLAFSDGHLFVRLPDGLACYDLTKAGNPGAVVISAPTPKPDKGPRSAK
jgi:outer membrane protein assembly factor BamB